MHLDTILYPMIFKRKSFHLFFNIGNEKISMNEISTIYEAYEKMIPMCPNIKTAIRIVPAGETTCKRGQEYCILIYSEKKSNYLQNVGYLGQQLDLFLVSKNIGTLWFGIGKTPQCEYQGLDFVIMLAISKIDNEKKFRKDMFKIKRKPKEEIWMGEDIAGVTNIIRFVPSACNTQPWIVENNDSVLQVYRYKKQGKRGIMPVDMVTFYNRIDIGIFLCFLELCLEHNNINFKRELFSDIYTDVEKTLVATYDLH